MGNLKYLVISTSFAALTAGAAIAADLPPIVDIPQEVVPTVVGGWYLRGDIGYAKTKVDGIRYMQGNQMSGEFDVYDIDNSWMIGGGIGYQVNDWFRVDWTANHFFEADMTGSSALNVACSDGTANAVCSYRDNNIVGYTTLLANAYIDMGTWQGLTPYVGAGIGGAYTHWSDFSNQEYYVSGATPTTTALDTHPARNGWRFAYALHAGASYDLTSKLKLDAGYTFTHIENGEMFGFGNNSGLVGTQGYHGDIKSHAFKVGLRYSLY